MRTRGSRVIGPGPSSSTSTSVRQVEYHLERLVLDEYGDVPRCE